MPTRSRARRVLVVPASLAFLVPAVPAGAHVGVDPSTTVAGEYAVLTISVAHGCAESPTTRVAIRMPEEILSVTPTRHPLWQVSEETEPLSPAVTDAHGNSVTERDAVVVYTAETPLPDGQRDSFELSVLLPEGVGDTLSFPTIQTCTEGETAWTEVPVDGRDAHDLEHPAPTLTLTAAEGAGAAATVRLTSTTGGGQTAGSGALGVGTLVAAVLALVAGVAALARTRRRA